MADQGTSARPKRSAARDAQIKVEESFEKWGQPPPENDARRATPARKRSTTAESSAARKRRRTSIQHHNEPASPAVVPRTEPEGDAPTQPVKRRVGRPRKNPVHQHTPEFNQATKKVTLSVPNSPNFKEGLHRIWSPGEDAGTSAGSHFDGQAQVVEGVIEDAMPNAPIQETMPDNTAYELGGPVLPGEIDSTLPELLAHSQDSSESPILEVEIPRVLRDINRLNVLSLETETPSPERASPFNSERTHFSSLPISSDTQPSTYFDRIRGLHHSIISTFQPDQQQILLPGYQSSVIDTQAIRELAAQMEQEANPDARARVTAYLDNFMSVKLRGSLAKYGVIPLQYYFRAQAVKELGCRNVTDILSAPTSPGIQEPTEVPGESTLRPVENGDVNIINKSSARDQELGIRSERVPIAAASFEGQRFHLPGRVRVKSFYPLPRNTQVPNRYFDPHPHGSSVGAHSIDPLVGLIDHSDPRTFYTPNSEDRQHVFDALQPTIEHFRQLTGGVNPTLITLDSGYEVAQTLLQAHLRLWFVENRPKFAHNNEIPRLFKLERWNGGIKDWKSAINFAVSLILP